VSSMGCMVLQPFDTSGSRSFPDFWIETGDPLYLGYKTPIVASEPSVEQMARVVYSMEGRIGTHMILWVLPRGSEV
jgi:hypothetical protein